jgi:hypothetical protein
VVVVQYDDGFVGVLLGVDDGAGDPECLGQEVEGVLGVLNDPVPQPPDPRRGRRCLVLAAPGRTWASSSLRVAMPWASMTRGSSQPDDHAAPPRDLTDMIDFSPLGSTDRSPLRLMTVTAAGPVRLSDEERRKRAGEAVAFMPQGFGFTTPAGICRLHD